MRLTFENFLKRVRGYHFVLLLAVLVAGALIWGAESGAGATTGLAWLTFGLAAGLAVLASVAILWVGGSFLLSGDNLRERGCGLGLLAFAVGHAAIPWLLRPASLGDAWGWVVGIGALSIALSLGLMFGVLLVSGRAYDG